ncbi:MAG: gliding motility-associated C-terminal domain-containing protein [Sphingobacteriaceae bacterium]|nr:gliding motility-associated C-terminal domain-containing protein [Sphingobacteriaceae bacterium]
MKKVLFSIFILFAFISNKAQNDDCVDAIPLCTNPNFTFNANSGPGNVVDFTTASNISNPQTNPNPPNMGCLLSGELKPQWLLLTVGNAGSLEFVFGASASANPQAGFYDWAMWPYTPSSCSQIFNNTLAPIRCNWNGTSTGGTGMASAANIPAGGDPSNYEAPLTVNACQQFIICISNYSGVNTLVSFQSIGSASLSCNPNCNPSYAVCPGATIAVMPVNFANLANPTFSLFPGPMVNTTGTFVLTPSVSTQYTTYITGTNSSNAVQTISATLNVTVHPKPYTSPLVMNASCSNIVTNSVNLNVTFNPSGSPNYTTTWSPMPSTVTTVNSGTAAGLTPGVNNVTITTSNGCTNVATFTVAPIPQQASFTIVNPSGDYTLTCLNPNVLLTTSVTNGVPLTFTWFPSCTGTVSGASMNFTQPCTGQVVGTSPTGCQFVQTYTVYQNLTSPTIVVTPTVNSITCAGGSGCFTVTSNLGPNVTTNWFQVSGTNTVYVGIPQGTINTYCAGSLGSSNPPGVFWAESVNNLTGCKSTKSVQVTASVGVPIFTVTSPTNFTIGCGSTSITSMQVTTVITSPVPNVACQYTFVPPATTGTPTTFTLNPNQNGIILPGTWVVYVKDITNNCISSQSISIIQNTIAPNVDFIQPLSLLTCREPSMVLNGISSNPNTQITWTVPAIPSNSINPTPNHTVFINPAITGATNNITSVGIFTVGAVDINNQCRSTKTVQILQDIRLPKFTISALTNSVITCKNPDVVIVPIITPTLAVALVPTYVWYPPVGPGVAGSSFNSTAAGSHTAISTSVVNGCTTSATYIVGIDVTPPAISAALPFTLDCNVNPTASLMPTITGTTTGFTYSWTAPPGALTSNLTSSLLVTNKSGLYRVLVTNTLNGCAAQESYSVVNGVLNADFIPSSIFGFAPLTVNFNNTSSTSTGASSILCLWSYGNGIATSTTILNTVAPVTTYTAAGTYTVVLLAKKGSCVDSAMRIIRVEIPSKMEIPNVFTPNGDKANDVFRLIASSLKEVSVTIFDRWGNKVYELTSDTGNFGWDGKNQYGKECAAGTYFYIIKAIGNDGVEFDQKGNVSLFR